MVDELPTVECHCQGIELNAMVILYTVHVYLALK
jgi:hypothetical protein